MDGITELAVMLKERENRSYLGPQIGVVVAPLPDIKVRLGDEILLSKERLIIAAHLLSKESDPSQSIVINGDLPGADDDSSTVIGSIKFFNGTPSGDSRSVLAINIEKGTLLEAFFNLDAGDEVMLIPTTDNQRYFLVDKVVRI